MIRVGIVPVLEISDLKHVPTPLVEAWENRLTETMETVKSRLPLLRCKCGAEILLLPDMKAMDKAIQAHAQSHSQAERNPYRAAAEVIRVQDHLIGQMLRKAGGNNREVVSF